MNPQRLLDSYAILAYLNREAGAEKVFRVMAEARDAHRPLLISEIDVGEVYYFLIRIRPSIISAVNGPSPQRWRTRRAAPHK